MRNTSALFPVFLCLVLLAGGATAQDDGLKKLPPAINWQDYHLAMAEARDHDKPILLHFTAGASKWTEKMKTETYRDSEVIDYLTAHFATGWVDTERFQKLARQYEINALPTLWFLDAKGKGLTVIDGYVSPEKLLSVLQFIQTGSYTEMSFQEWTDRAGKRSP